MRKRSLTIEAQSLEEFIEKSKINLNLSNSNLFPKSKIQRKFSRYYKLPLPKIIEEHKEDSRVSTNNSSLISIEIDEKNHDSSISDYDNSDITSSLSSCFLADSAGSFLENFENLEVSPLKEKVCENYDIARRS